MDGIRELSLELKPPVAQFKIDAQRYSIQDLIKSVETVGSEFDARLMLQSQADDTKLSGALRSVPGVRSAGSPDSKGIRLLTFHMEQRTLFGDLQKAASAIGAEVRSPTLKD